MTRQVPAADPYASQGYYAAPSGAPPPASDYNNNAPLLPGYPSAAAAPHQMYGQPPPQQQQQQQPPQHQQQHSPYGGQPQQQQYDPYGGYDAINYPSIPALLEHSQRAQPSSRQQSNSSYSSPSASVPRRASKPQEESGAAYGNARYRCMLLPTRDGGDIEVRPLPLFPPRSSDQISVPPHTPCHQRIC
jgi:hypothetical protein